MKPRVIAARPMPELVVERLKAEFSPVFAEIPNLDATGVIERAKEHRADALLVTSDIRFGAAEMEMIPDFVKVIATCSVGFEHLDVRKAKEKNIVLTNTPDAVTECTADLTLLLILGAARRANEYAAIMRNGWRRSFAWNDMLGIKVSGKTLGIVGMGRIGRAVAKRAEGFGMKVIYTDNKRLGHELEGNAHYFSSLAEMLPHSQFISLHLPVTEESKKMMNDAAFALLPKNAVFVNAARGGLVDEEALINALRSGHLYAAGLDVYANEPEYDLRISEFPNVFLMPHVGTSTVETRAAMGFRALDNIISVCNGKAALDPLW